MVARERMAALSRGGGDLGSGGGREVGLAHDGLGRERMSRGRFFLGSDRTWTRSEPPPTSSQVSMTEGLFSMS